MTLRWRGVTCELHAKRPPPRRPSAASSASASSPAPRTILRDVGGAARPGRLLAILGPSGSGKTSLLNVLARQVPFNPKMTLHGELVATSDDAGRNTAYRVAYVQQQDVFYSQLTVRETLQTAAELRAPRESRSPAERAAAVDDAFAASTHEVRGHARGRREDARRQRRRTQTISVGVRNSSATSPAVVCADEPTSGLDAFQAQRVMESLRDLARDERKTVVASIHQPRGSIVDLFDDVCLMAGGRVVYCGPAADAARWFGERAPAPRVTPRNFSWTSCPRTRRRPRRRRRRRRAWTRWWRRGREGRETGTARRPSQTRHRRGDFRLPFKSASWKTAAGKAGGGRARGRVDAPRVVVSNIVSSPLGGVRLAVFPPRASVVALRFAATGA